MGQSYSHRVLSKLHLLSSVCVGVAKGVDSRLPRISPGHWLHFGAASSCGSKMLNNHLLIALWQVTSSKRTAPEL